MTSALASASSRAIEEPMRWIAQNAGQEGSIIVNKVKELDGEQGYNAAKGKYENLVNSGVIDPTKVVRYALQNASSIAGLMLTTEALISELPEKEEAKAGGAPGGMPPGMGDMGDFLSRSHALREPGSGGARALSRFRGLALAELIPSPS